MSKTGDNQVIGACYRGRGVLGNAIELRLIAGPPLD